MNGNIFNYFPGGNTSLGFYSFYKYIIKPQEARRIICIKGGPGTGKSTLMKKICCYFNEKGYDIELHHCSSDNNSIDGIVIRHLNVAFIDGTSPHVTDPLYPGAVDEILNLGNYWDEGGFKASRNQIIETCNEISVFFQSSYKYLAAAKLMYEDLENHMNKSLVQNKTNLLERDMTNKIFSTNLSKTGCTRHLFATAFTPDGIITFIQNLIENYGIIYALNGSPGTGKSQLLNSICLAASRNGFDTEIYHHPLIPGKIEHILIPELNTAIVTSNELNKITFTGTQIYMENYIQIDRKNYDKSSAAYTKDTFNSLIQRALELLNSAKKLHDQLETCYIPNMNFKELDNVYDSLINKISGYEKEML